MEDLSLRAALINWAADLDAAVLIERVRSTTRREFGLYWSATTVSAFGDSIRTAAIPLVAASVTHDPMLISLVSFAGFVPWVLGSVLGVTGDILDSRWVCILMNLARMLLGIGLAMSILHFGANLLVLALMSAGFTICLIAYGGAASSLLTRIVPKHGLAKANARIQIAKSAMGNLSGAPVGAILVSMIAWLPFLVDVLTFAIATVGLYLIRTPARIDADGKHSKWTMGAVISGLRAVRSSPYALESALLLSCINFVSAAVSTIAVLYVIVDLRQAESIYGVYLGLVAVGGIVSGMLVRRVLSRFLIRRSLIGALLLRSVVLVVLGVTSNPLVAAVAFFGQGLSMTVWNVICTTLVQQEVAHRFLSRVTSTIGAMSVSSAPLGALAGGASAQLLGLRSPMLLGALVVSCGGLFLVRKFPAKPIE